MQPPFPLYLYGRALLGTRETLTSLVIHTPCQVMPLKSITSLSSLHGDSFLSKNGLMGHINVLSLGVQEPELTVFCPS